MGSVTIERTFPGRLRGSITRMCALSSGTEACTDGSAARAHVGHAVVYIYTRRVMITHHNLPAALCIHLSLQSPMLPVQ